MTLELIAHLIVLVVAIAVTVVIYGQLLKIWAAWVTVNVEGAARTVFVGHHGWLAKGYVLPDPLKGNNRATLLKGPLVRPEAYVDTDRDEVNMEFTVPLEGAPSSTEESDRPQVRIRISWSTADFVPYYDMHGDPGDHDRIPPNLIIPQEELAPGVVQRFMARGVYAFLPRASVGENNVIRKFVPGAAAIVFMNKYTDGEHLERLFEFLRQHAIEIFGGIHVRQLERIATEGAAATTVHQFDQLQIRIRGHVETFQGDNPDDSHYTPTAYRNTGEFRRVLSAFLTKVMQIEMEPYGVFVNDVTIVDIRLPKRIVDASRDREARTDQVESMRRFGKGLAKEVGRLTAQGMNADVAGAYLADSIATESRPGTLGLIFTLFDRYFKSS